jgi:hypothetical protein
MIKIDACAPPHCSCPHIEVYEENETVLIMDDDDDIVKMSIEEFHLLAVRFLKEFGEKYGRIN